MALTTRGSTNASEHEVYVGNLHHETSEDELRALFEPYALTSIKLSIGFAHLYMSSAGGAASAVDTMHGKLVHGRAIICQHPAEVRYVKSNDDDDDDDDTLSNTLSAPSPTDRLAPSPADHQQSSELNTTLFVKNIPAFAANTTMLRRLFRPFGTVTGIYIHPTRPEFTTRACFVDFDTPKGSSAANNAVHHIGPYKLNVSFKKKRSAPDNSQGVAQEPKRRRDETNSHCGYGRAPGRDGVHHERAAPRDSSPRRSLSPSVQAPRTQPLCDVMTPGQCTTHTFESPTSHSPCAAYAPPRGFKPVGYGPPLLREPPHGYEYVPRSAWRAPPHPHYHWPCAGEPILYDDILQRKDASSQRSHAHSRVAQEGASAPEGARRKELTDKLKLLKELLADGLLTEADVSAQKAKLMDQL